VPGKEVEIREPDLVAKLVQMRRAIVSAALEHVRLEEVGRVNQAIEATSGTGLRSPELGGPTTTHEVGDAVLAYLSRRPELT
jgi:hypothetical protein